MTTITNAITSATEQPTEEPDAWRRFRVLLEGRVKGVEYVREENRCWGPGDLRREAAAQ
jgi:hypothetical protein